MDAETNEGSALGHCGNNQMILCGPKPSLNSYWEHYSLFLWSVGLRELKGTRHQKMTKLTSSFLMFWVYIHPR